MATNGEGCPVDHSAKKPSSSWNPLEWFSKNVEPPEEKRIEKKGECPVKHNQVDACPVKHSGGSSFALPASIEESARHAQTPHPDQRVPLSTHRVVSTIPRADELREEPLAAHQPGEGSKWVYPSEQQFYNAMRRKGWDGVDETTIPLVVRIHNSVNEKAWNEVRRWEQQLHGVDDPRLVRFLGRPKDMSFKALVNTYLLWYNAPFDRHDWFVDRGDGKEPRRYIVDFYNGNDGMTSGTSLLSSVLQRARGGGGSNDGNQNAQPDNQAIVPRPPAMYIDVRPAGDNPEAFVDRIHMFFRESFPGIFGLFGNTSHPSPVKRTYHEQGKRND